MASSSATSWAAESRRSREKAWYAATKKRVMFSGIREVISMYHFHVVEAGCWKDAYLTQ